MLTQHLSQQLFILTPHGWAEEHRIETWFAESEQIFAACPKVQSVEADRIVTGAAAEFGLPKAVLSAKAQVANLSSQVQWAKAQTLAFIGLATYMFDKVIGWEHIRHGILYFGRHFVK